MRKDERKRKRKERKYENGISALWCRHRIIASRTGVYARKQNVNYVRQKRTRILSMHNGAAEGKIEAALGGRRFNPEMKSHIGYSLLTRSSRSSGVHAANFPDEAKIL